MSLPTRSSITLADSLGRLKGRFASALDPACPSRLPLLRCGSKTVISLLTFLHTLFDTTFS